MKALRNMLTLITAATLVVTAEGINFDAAEASNKSLQAHFEKNEFTSPLVTQNHEFFNKSLESSNACFNRQERIPITNKLLNKHGEIKIKDAGYYVFAEELCWHPKADGQVAITICSSNVVIDLNHFNLKQSKHSTTSNNIGIQVNANHKNIIIKNGTIENVSTFGLLVYDGVNDLVLENLNLFKNGARGTFDGYAGTGVFLRDFETIGNVAAGGAEIRGLPDNPVKNVFITNCNFCENTSSNICWGLFAGFLQDSFICNSNFSDNVGVPYTAGAGIAFPNDVDFYNNHGTNNSSTGTDLNNGFSRAFGIACWSTTGFRIDHCLFSKNHATFEAGGVDSDPGSISGINGPYLPLQGFEVTNCVSDRNFVFGIPNSIDNGRSGFAHGYNLKQFDMVKNCTASNIYALGSPSVPNVINACLAFLLPDSLGGVLEDCIALNIGEPLIDGQTIVSNAINFGFFVSANPPNPTNFVPEGLVIRRCIAQNVTTTNGDFAAGFGNRFPDFISFANPGTIFEDCIAEDNIAGNNQGVGFAIAHMPQTIIKNCIARRNNVGYLVDNQTGAFSYTIPPSNKCVIYKNLASNNTVAGFKDDPANINVYKNNEADNNGSNPSVDNYVGMPTGTSIVTWNLGAGNPPPAQITAYDNLSVIQ